MTEKRSHIIYEPCGQGYTEVGRAALPKTHAIYDTRTHVAVPVALIEESASALEKVASGSITGNNHSHRPWARSKAYALRALLPTESEGV